MDIKTKHNWLIGDQESIADWCIWPFVRQFKIACESQKKTNFLKPNIKIWLENYERHPYFDLVMHKYEKWENSSKMIFFPPY